MDRSRTYPIKAIDAPGYKIEDRQLLNTLRQDVARLLGRNNSGFPGAQPVSFKRQHLDELRQRE
jgi:mRNA guanylyltransferase